MGHQELDDTLLFHSYEAVTSFLAFYQRYDFLEPLLVGKYGKSPEQSNTWNKGGSLASGDSAHMLQHFDRIIANATGSKFMSLKEEVLDSVNVVAARRQVLVLFIDTSI